ncbi:MAG: hypothetical protein N2Z85_01480, partial [Patescibacteria group bacterium]|nr:hypothetical protein [Patescibacteria group bacterium]
MDFNNFENKKNIIIESEEDKIIFPWKKIFIFFLIFFGIIAGFIGYILYKPNPPQINMEIKLPPEILSGQGFDAEVIINNNSLQDITNAKLILNLPDGVYFLEEDPDKRMLQINIGNIASSSMVKQNFKLISFSQQLSVKTIEAKLNYKINNSNIYFENTAYIDLDINKSAFNILVSAPEKIYNSQNFKMIIKYENNSDYDYDNLKIKIDYPPIFKFISSNPNTEGNIWTLNQINKKSSGTIELTGQLIGQEGQAANLIVSIIKDIYGQPYVLSSQNYNLIIAKSSLALDILLNNDYYYVAKIGDKLRYVFKYKNNSNIPIENIILTAKLNSQLFDFYNVQTNAYFDSLNNSFIWNASNNSDFKILPPGSSGEVTLDIKLKNEFLIQNNNDKNFVLKVSAQIESPTVLEGVTSN